MPEGQLITVTGTNVNSSFNWGTSQAIIGPAGTAGMAVYGETMNGMDYLSFSFGPTSILSQSVTLTLGGFVWDPNPGTPFEAQLFSNGNVLFNSATVDGDELTVIWDQGGMNTQGLQTVLKLVHIPENPAVPEPGTYALMGSFLASAVALRRRRTASIHE